MEDDVESLEAFIHTDKNTAKSKGALPKKIEEIGSGLNK
jgi:hypothetical protein